ncbi:uncharacterized protein RAG0_14043 [Rhynchosporium agropyri]|uniref:Uncharacterized protein n=1 Tax=Rhynchosporium agropyri TaxID=914238 RepID=A0A1E1LFH1_9HELO|nr:uncharacterized protein RAG0_14043 [Rhynchosporium agropyri]
MDYVVQRSNLYNIAILAQNAVWFNQPGIVGELSDSPNEILVTRKEMERFGDITQLVILRQLGITAPASELAEFAYSTVRGFASRRTPGT